MTTKDTSYVTADGHLVVSVVDRRAFGKYHVMASSTMGEAYSQEYTVSEGYGEANKFETVFTTADKSISLERTPKNENFDCVTSFG